MLAVQFFTKLRTALTLFWRLAKPYWFSSEKKSALVILTSVISLTLGLVYVLVLLNKWNNEFYQALQDYNSKDFYRLLLNFAGLATVFILISVYRLYLTQLLQIKWRRWMTANLLDSWLSDRTYYLWQLFQKTVDNPDQRISEDIKGFVDDSLNLFLGGLREVVTLVSFIGILWGLSGSYTLTAFGMNPIIIHGYMVWICILYALMGTWITHLVGRKLIFLSFQQQQFEANFRFSLVRLRENAESVALTQGEPAEKSLLHTRFQDVVANFRSIMTKQKHLTFFTVFYSQVANIFPILVAAPRYFSKEIALGGLMQIANSFDRVQGALSFFVDAYPRLAAWWATVQRLDGFVSSMHTTKASAAENQTSASASPDSSLHISNLKVKLPTGDVLIQEATFTLKPGATVLLSGASGSGKSTLLRAVSGIWPFVEGKIALPLGLKGMVLPQKPYLPVDSLLAAITYPSAPADFSLTLVKEMMIQCKIDYLIPRLSDVDSWQLILSPGEQQRIAFTRLFLQNPDWVFMDEATSALDEATQNDLYESLRKRYPQMSILSIAHRRSVREFHDQEMILENKVLKNVS